MKLCSVILDCNLWTFVVGQVQTNLVVKHDIIYGNLIHSGNKGLKLSHDLVVTFCEVHMDV